MTEHTSSISSVDAAFAALKAVGISEGTIEQGIKELVQQRDAARDAQQRKLVEILTAGGWVGDVPDICKPVGGHA